MALLVAEPVRAQGFYRLGRWDAKAEFYLDWRKQDDLVQGAPSASQETTLYQEKVTIRNRGASIVDPRFMRLDFGGSVGLSQEQGFPRVGTGELLGYAFDSVLLPERAYTLALFANREQSTRARGFFGGSDVLFENRGGTFWLRENSFLRNLGLHFFDSILDARQELTKEETRFFGSAFKRDETRTILSYDARKGFETADLNLRYEFNDVDDVANPLNRFRTQTGLLLYSLDFGPTLNRQWDSRLNFFRRTGGISSTFLSADEHLRIDHYENLLTDYDYSFVRSESEAGIITTSSGTFDTRYRFHRNLTSHLSARGSLQDFPNGDRAIYGGRMGLDYQRTLPWNGKILAGAGFGYQLDDNRFSVSRADIVDEPHTAPSELGAGAGFTLDNRFVILETIVVVDTRDGNARLPTTRDVDYRVVQEGDFTKIIPLDTSPVILPGDQLAVSYAFAVSPDIRFSTASWRGNLGVDFQWIAAFLDHEQTDETRLSGQLDGQFLEDRRRDKAQLDLHGDWERVRARSTVAYEIWDSTRLKFTGWRLGQLLSFQASPFLMMRLTADQSFLNFTLPDRRAATYAVRGAVDWRLLPRLSLSSFAGIRSYEETVLPTEQVREAGVRAQWTYRSLQVAPSFTWSDRRDRLSDFHGELRITRSLF